MPDYKKLYFKLFNDLTDTIEHLKRCQQEAEELYLSQSEEDDGRLLMVGQEEPSDLPAKNEEE